MAGVRTGYRAVCPRCEATRHIEYRDGGQRAVMKPHMTLTQKLPGGQVMHPMRCVEFGDVVYVDVADIVVPTREQR